MNIFILGIKYAYLQVPFNYFGPQKVLFAIVIIEWIMFYVIREALFLKHSMLVRGQKVVVFQVLFSGTIWNDYMRIFLMLQEATL